MGNYLDSRASFTAYSEVYKSPYFVDISAILEKLIPRIGISEKYVCITRPREFVFRFLYGKSGSNRQRSAIYRCRVL